MRNILPATLLTGVLLCGVSLAQSTAPSTAPSSADPSASQPQTQTPQAEGQAQQQPEPQAAPPSTQAPASAQPSANQGQAAATPRIAPGSVIPVQLTKTIDAKKAKPGDELVAKVTMDLKTNSGEIVVPKDTKVVGHVTEAQARSKEQKESQVAITFDHAVVKGADMTLPMSIQAVIAPPTNNASGGGGYDQAAPASGSGTATSSAGGGRNSSAGGSGQSQPANTASNAGSAAGDTPQQGSPRPQITGNTQGVIGIDNLKLEAAPNATQGSVLSSEKNNVKVESGTMLLLKVTQ
jgi:hypothetical protein